MIRKTVYIPNDFSPAKTTEKILQKKNTADADSRKITAQSSENSAENNVPEKNELKNEKEIEAQSTNRTDKIPFWLLAAILLCLNK